MRDTIELCKAAGFPLMSFEGVTYVSLELERLVALVRADERAAPDLQAELDATNRQVEILSDALAESRREVAALKAVQEPFGYFRYDMRLDAWVQSRNSNQGTAFYTTPPAAQPASVQPVLKDNSNYRLDPPEAEPAQRSWVGLTDEEILDAAGIDGADTWLFETAYAIEAKLKEKNT